MHLLLKAKKGVCKSDVYTVINKHEDKEGSDAGIHIVNIGIIKWIDDGSAYSGFAFKAKSDSIALRPDELLFAGEQCANLTEELNQGNV